MMNTDIRYWFPKKPNVWLIKKEKALAHLNSELKKLGKADTEPFIRIAISALIKSEQPKKVDHPSDRKKKRSAKLKALKKAIDALGLELRLPLKEMYGIKLPNIDPDAVAAYIDDESKLDLDELYPPKESSSLNDWIAREVLQLTSSATTYECNTFRKTVRLIYDFLEIEPSEDHPCRHAIKPPPSETKSIAAKKWRDEQIDKGKM